MLNKLTECIRTTENSSITDYWLSNDSCNKLIETADSVRVTGDGIIELKFGTGDIVGIKAEGVLVHDGTKIAYVKVRYLNDEFNAASSAKNCEVL